MKVRLFGTLRQFAAAKEVEIEVEPGDMVQNALMKVRAKHPALGKKLLDESGNLQSSIHVLINGRSIRFLDGLDTSIQEGDDFALFPAVGGG